MHGIKRVEGRSWPTDHRGRLWIAATAQEPSPATVQASAGSLAILHPCLLQAPRPGCERISVLQMGCICVVDPLQLKIEAAVLMLWRLYSFTCVTSLVNENDYIGRTTWCTSWTVDVHQSFQSLRIRNRNALGCFVPGSAPSAC